MKKFNFNKFGRFNGGVPGKIGKYRGNALAESGEIINVELMHEIRGAGDSLDAYSSREDVRAVRNFYKTDQENYDYKRTYYQNDIMEFKMKHWSILKYFILLVISWKLMMYSLSEGRFDASKRKKKLDKIIKKDVEIKNGVIFGK